MFDTRAALIVFVIFGLIAFPIILIGLNKRKKRTALLRKFDLLCGKVKTSVSVKEVWKESYIIGIDNNSRKLIYIHQSKERGEEAVIDLSEIDRCKIVSYNKTSGNQTGPGSNSDRIELVLSNRKQGNPGKVLEFYDNKEFMPTTDDFSLAQKWQKLISEVLEESGK